MFGFPALGPLIRGFVRSDFSEADHSEACPVHVLCSNDSYTSKQVKRSPFSAWNGLRRRLAAFTAASHAEGHWFDPSRDHHEFLQVKRLGVGLL
jgi:hypothetical protein